MSSEHDKPCPLKPWTFQLLLLIFVSVCVYLFVCRCTPMCVQACGVERLTQVSLFPLCSVLHYSGSVSRWKPELVIGSCSSQTCSGDLVSSSAHQPLKLFLVGVIGHSNKEITNTKLKVLQENRSENCFTWLIPGILVTFMQEECSYW